MNKLTELKSGHFNIFPLLAFVADNPAMSSGEGLGIRGLKSEVNKLLEGREEKEVPKRRGWYLWGRFNDIGWWETIYLGKSGNQKTSSLVTRLSDELMEESVALWAFVYGREVAAKQKSHIYKGKYDKQTPRSLRKMYAQFIIWIAADNPISEEEVKRQEALLIDIYRPTHNATRPKCSNPDDLTQDIKDEVDEQIKRIQGFKFKKVNEVALKIN
jgi:hypothetical protein